jgi:predicted RNA-binding protein with PIN domain
MPYLVDGNNLMGTIAGMKVEDASAREELLQMLSRFCHTKGSKLLVIFDGPPHAGLRKKMHYGRVSARFAGPELDADTAILREIEKSRHPREIIVVTSDSRVYQKARTLGAQAINSRDFHTTVQDCLSVQTEEQIKRGLSGTEVDDWMKFFGFSENEKDE